MSLYTHPTTARGPTYIGGRLVYPGETVVIADVQADPAPAAAPAGDRDLQALSGGPITAIDAVLPDLSLAELEALLMIEQASAKPRVTLVDKINAEALKRRAQA